MKYQYEINLLKGDHGIWLFVSNKDKGPPGKPQLLFEQAAIKSVEEAFKFAAQVIANEEHE